MCFFHLYSVVKATIIILYRNEENENALSCPWFGRNAFNLSPFREMLAVDWLHIAFLRWDRFPLFLVSQGLIMKGVDFSKPLPVVIKMIPWFLSLKLLRVSWIYLFILELKRLYLLHKVWLRMKLTKINQRQEERNSDTFPGEIWPNIIDPKYGIKEDQSNDSTQG